MRKLLNVLWDYAINALMSAGIGALVAAALALALRESALNLAFAGRCVLIGLACGTISKSCIEGAFVLFGKRPPLGYAMNAVIVALVVLAMTKLLFGGLGGLSPWLVALIFALPEAASFLIVRKIVLEARKVESALGALREELDAKGDD
jgi:hypothetical protein